MAFDLPAFTLTPAMCAPVSADVRDAMATDLEVQSLAHNGVLAVLILIDSDFRPLFRYSAWHLACTFCD
jgi:hypothetical protein